MITIAVALLVFILVYVVAKLLLSKVDGLASMADLLAIVVGILAALWSLGVVH